MILAIHLSLIDEPMQDLGTLMGPSLRLDDDQPEKLEHAFESAPFLPERWTYDRSFQDPVNHLQYNNILLAEVFSRRTHPKIQLLKRLQLR